MIYKKIFVYFTFNLYNVSLRYTQKQESLTHNGSIEDSFLGACSFLYIADLSTFSQ